MRKLTPELCKQLEETVLEKVCPSSKEKPGDAFSDLYKLIAQISSRAAIATIQEYENLKNSGEDSL